MTNDPKFAPQARVRLSAEPQRVGDVINVLGAESDSGQKTYAYLVRFGRIQQVIAEADLESAP